MKLETDSGEYELLTDAVASVRDVPGLICEIGTRKGGSLQLIIDALLENGDEGRTVLSIDNYGHMLYQWGMDRTARLDYTNDMRNEAYKNLYEYVTGKPVNLLVFTLEDSEFFNRYWDGVPVYKEEKRLEARYALAFLDGPHDVTSLKKEILFFAARTEAGARIVVDDIDFFNVDELTEFAAKTGFKVDQIGEKKIVYEKLERVR